jgi:hypothetical protein
MLTIHGQYHPKADIDRLYVPSEDGGRGLIHAFSIQSYYSIQPVRLISILYTEDFTTYC